MKEGRDHWSKFYWSDWRSDPRLRVCSFGARGLWIDMLSIMHEAEPYGHLLVAGIAPTPKQLAAMLGGTAKEIAKYLSELEQAEVFSRNATGVIFSRRMVRDQHRRAINRENGKVGGNPKLKDNRSGENRITDPDMRSDYPKRITKPDNHSDKSRDARDLEARKLEARKENTTQPSSSPAARPDPAPESPGGVEQRPAAQVIREAKPDTRAEAEKLFAWLEGEINSPRPLAMHPIVTWLEAGATPELIRALVKDLIDAKRRIEKSWVPGSLSYFQQAILRAVAEGRTAEPTQAGSAEGQSSQVRTREDIRAEMQAKAKIIAGGRHLNSVAASDVRGMVELGWVTLEQAARAGYEL